MKQKFSLDGSLSSDPKNKDVELGTDQKTQYPYFSFRNFSDKQYGLLDLQNDDYQALVKTLCKLSKLTWTQIESSPRHGCGTEIIKRTELKANIPFCYNDKQNVIAFRYKGNAPMICVRNRNLVDVLFTDTNFTLYKH